MLDDQSKFSTEYRLDAISVNKATMSQHWQSKVLKTWWQLIQQFLPWISPLHTCICCVPIRLSELELFLPSFHAQYGYRNKLCAADVVRACEALLDSMVCVLHILCLQRWVGFVLCLDCFITNGLEWSWNSSLKPVKSYTFENVPHIGEDKLTDK